MLTTVRSFPSLPLRYVHRGQKTGSPISRRPVFLQATTEVDPTNKEQVKDKYYGRVPGFPNLVIEYDVAPNDKKAKGRFDIRAVIALSFGMVLMLSVVATLLTVGQYL